MATITFTGDIAFSKHFKDHWNKDFLDGEIRSFLTASDHVVANVECPMTASVVTSKMEIVHFSDPAAGSWFKSIGADIWALSNNHAMDCGEAGFLDTKAAAEANGAVTVGAGRNIDEAAKPLILSEAGGIGILAVTYKRGEFIRATADGAGCLLFDEPERIAREIKQIKAQNRWCVVVAHGGDEFCNLPMPYMRRLYRSFLKMGADVVVGHHPHVVQGYERLGEKFIFYSLGNFVFDTDYQRQQNYSENGVLLKLHFDESAFIWEYLATKVNREKQTVETAEAPIVFCHVSEKNYRLLWPLAARKFLQNYKVAKKFVQPKAKDYNRRQWFAFHRDKYGKKDALHLHFGKWISCLGLWKLAPKELKEYIEEK